MTERRKRRNEEIRAKFKTLRAQGIKVDDALEPIAETYALEAETVRKIIYDKNYCRRNGFRTLINEIKGG